MHAGSPTWSQRTVTTGPATRRLLTRALLFLLACGGTAEARDWSGPVQRVVSADTLQIGGDTLHLWGIEAPDPKRMCRGDAGARRLCGELAREALTGLTRGAVTRCERRGTIPDFGLIAVCSANGRDLGRELVLGGWALAEARFEGYRTEEAAARAALRGLWATATSDP